MPTETPKPLLPMWTPNDPPASAGGATKTRDAARAVAKVAIFRCFLMAASLTANKPSQG